jgi:gliding motility-associated-like protein
LAGNSTDNCGIRNIVIDNNQYSCFDLDQIVTKTVRVIDNSDNITSCEGTFNLSNASIPVSFSVGICPEDSLILFLNIPQRDEFVYDWDGPLGFSSVLARPFIPDVKVVHEGNYRVTVTNTLTGCVSTGSVDVLVDDVKKPEFETEEIGCTAIPHRLSSTSIEGEVVYNWYQYIDNARFLLAVSEDPFIDISFDPGDYILGLTVTNGQCESTSSNRIPVEIRGQPEGAICTTLIEGCIGESLELCANDPDEDFIIRWFGPNGFVSSDVMPIVTDSFTSEFSGVYKLVIEDNLCITDTLTTTVTTNATPPIPEIIGTLRYCAGEQIELASSEIQPGYIYVWNSPSGTIRNNQPVLRIPNAGSQFTGQWTLSIESGPCVSKPSQPVFLDIEQKINFAIKQIATQCEGSQITLSSNAPPGAQILWTGPGNFISGETTPLVDVIEGFYQASITTLNGCAYTDEIFINTVIIPQIIGVEVSEEGPCINPESTLVIIPKFSIPADVQFEWVGPNITAQTSSLSIENYSFADNGIYTVKVLNGDCESEVFDFILNFIVSPIKPTVEADPIACLNDPLTITTNKYGNNAIYTWTTPEGTVETTENQLFFESVSTDVSGSYGVQVTIGECTSPVSDLVSIFVNDNVFVPTISSEGDECVENEYRLFTDFSENLDIEWELPSGELVTADTLSFLLQESDAGNYRSRSYSNGCPSEWSSSVEIDVLDPRNNISLVTDFIFSCNNDDAGIEFCVESSGPTSGIIFQWFLGEQMLGETTGLCFQVPDPSVFSFGQNQITLQFDYNACSIPFEDPLFLEIENVRDISASAGEDQLFCVGDVLLMNADDISTSELSGFWSVDDGVEVDDIRDPMAEIVVMIDVDSTFAVWNIEHFECGVVYSDSVVLKQKVKPLPMPDTISVDEARFTFEPLINDVLIDGNTYRITEVSNPRWGIASFSGTSITYEGDPKFIGGPVKFTYTVCDDACSGLCNEGEILILYNTGSCKGNNVLTPNNDGANDQFIIPCIDNENLPNNSLVILNELGNTIYEESPYNNTWDGTFNGQTLPEGTYYYIFRKDDNSSVVQGFISIER